jgi:hypothetical protein
MGDEPKQPSREWIGTAVASAVHKMLRLLFGTTRLAFTGALLSFVVGLGLTDVALDAFWLQRNDVVWVRLSGGLVALGVFLSVIKWRSGWSWPQFLVAIPLYLACLLLAACALNWIFAPRPDPIRDLCVAIVSAIAFGGAAWILVRRFLPRRKPLAQNSHIPRSGLD